MQLPTYLKFSDLKAQGIVNNRMTLSRWIRDHGFPRPVALGPNTAVYIEAEVKEWLDQRAAARAARAA
ncbi:helix-turn-helix transcriptional regulator [Dongia deserti]|uniref:helix-turn-helix transcriptional regulator n=1 Tax=Dongia deserti TaxID=2268030 RepID=UPI000E64D368|nr:AlpA family phage regulatory protein [Dongia deserti]